MKSFKEIKKDFFLKLDSFPIMGETLSIRKLTMEQAASIVNWRNDHDNVQLFELNNKITIESQKFFLDNYENLNRVDIVLYFNDFPIGVFNIKNLDTETEYGSLIGEKEFRGLGYGNLFKKAIFTYWFDVLGHKNIFCKIKQKNQFLIDSNLKKGFKVIRYENDLAVLKLDVQNYER